MRGFVLVLSVLLVAVNAYIPPCTDETAGFLWANTWDNTRFWQCTTRNMPPQLRTCAIDNFWFSYYHQQCVQPEHWLAPPPPPTVQVRTFVPQCVTEQMGWLWPNYNYENMFWQCTALNAAPALRECIGVDHLFSYYHQQCVHKTHWIEPAWPWYN